MKTQQIEITNLSEAKAGDNSRWRDEYGGNEYTGPLVEADGELRFAGVTVRYADGTVPASNGLTFVSGTRGVPAPELPDEPGSILINVTTTDGKKYSIGVRDNTPDNSGPWALFTESTYKVDWCDADEIESFTLAKVVRNE